MQINFVQVDYRNAKHAADLCALLREYSAHPMGGGKRLDDSLLKQLPEKMAEFPTTFSVLGYVDEEPAALANCLFGFSSFSCAPLVNIHDLVVREQFRGNGLSQKLLEKIEQIAIENDCCKLTLEVLDKNEVAIGAYAKFGFEGYELDPEQGIAVFWQKKLG